jgi:hypothetical protein
MTLFLDLALRHVMNFYTLLVPGPCADQPGAAHVWGSRAQGAQEIAGELVQPNWLHACRLFVYWVSHTPLIEHLLTPGFGSVVQI